MLTILFYSVKSIHENISCPILYILHAQWFSGSDSGIRARKSGLKWGSGPDFSELLPLLSGYHSNGALTFRSILYLTLQQLLGFRFIILSPITSISHNVISSNT
ncbi:hypothetical protein V8G54_000280 [Vigna mungo]|uniref:Uncharacterized protein n=1 Tax=Vigna mungo TaxID=3915 RepID=A0AAQ3SAF9_VIGMU